MIDIISWISYGKKIHPVLTEYFEPFVWLSRNVFVLFVVFGSENIWSWWSELQVSDADLSKELYKKYSAVSFQPLSFYLLLLIQLNLNLQTYIAYLK